MWDGAAGTSDAADPGAVPTADTQFRIGSITKTFTATLVMQCRDQGLLDLDDPLDKHLPGTRHPDLTVRRMLAHLSGLQREPVGDVWESLRGPSVDDLLARSRGGRGCVAAGTAPPLQQPRVRVAGRGRGPAARTAVGRGPAGAILDPLEMRRTTTARARRSPPGTSSIPTPAERSRRRSSRDTRSRPPPSSGRRPRTSAGGRRSSPSRRRRCCRPTRSRRCATRR